MSDAPTTPAPAPAAPEPGSIDAIQQEAKRTFNLRDRMTKRAKARSGKILVYMDLDAVAETVDAQRKLGIAQTQMERANAGADATAESRAKNAADIVSLERAVETARTSMLESALAIEIVALPSVAVDVCKRQARDVAKQDDSTIDQDIYGITYTKALLARAIFEIKASDGSYAERVKVIEKGNEVERADIDTLYEALPKTEWDRLDVFFANLQFENVVGQAATDEPGF